MQKYPKEVKIYVKTKSFEDIVPRQVKSFVRKVDSFIDNVARKITQLILQIIRKKKDLNLHFQSAFESFNDLFHGRIKADSFLYLAIKAYLYSVIFIYIGLKVFIGVDVSFLDVALSVLTQIKLKDQIESMIPPEKKLKALGKIFIQAGLIAQAIFLVFGITAILKELVPILNPIIRNLDDKMLVATSGVER